MKKYLKISLLVIFLLTTMSGTAMANHSDIISINVNKDIIETDAASYIDHGTTIVPLNVIQKIPGISVKWNNSNKTVTIIQDNKIIKLVAGQNSATIGSNKVKLPVASLIKNGRVMVPLRFIAEATDAYIGWNPYTRNVHIVKATQEMIEKTKSSDLAEARNATLQLPTVRLLKPITKAGGTDTQYYYFPEGKADQVFRSIGNGVEYLEAINGRLEQKWVGRIGEKGTIKGPFFLSSIEEEVGKQPIIDFDRITFFKLILPIGEADYGFINKDGKATTIGHQDMPGLYDFFNISEEK
ncbi:copper amine oxidase N-terminal domain-containing protein [Paenibacillus sp. 19GGS1-52]|uniref:copper amine oxidase N-terminal domain-containing protein n=1 Tax=Paenibacillus sp. 19GGS1-52 TaxID=2758563 RepID=UPI001EFB8FE8|nr:copper amine oxidase N-terminal domain-containing protein [Paenibacillus sp. 19GGS1-52]ULO09846.1 copper amine oxidase N-terminal domain-containing protein [Paenibacillus sp. 19GGS1-52]